MWRRLMFELSEVLWLAAMIGGLSIFAVVCAVAIAVSGVMPSLVFTF